MKNELQKKKLHCETLVLQDRAIDLYKAVGTILGLGGKIFLLITLFFQKDAILFISMSVISNIH